MTSGLRARNAYAAPAWAAEQHLGDVAIKATLLLLANYADEQFSCFPGQETIADETDQSVSTVYRQLKRLELLRLIRREKRYDRRGKRTSDRIFLNLDLVVDIRKSALDQEKSLHGNMTGSKSDVDSAGPGAEADGEQPFNMTGSNYQSQEPGSDGDYRSADGGTTGQEEDPLNVSGDRGTPREGPRGTPREDNSFRPRRAPQDSFHGECPEPTVPGTALLLEHVNACHAPPPRNVQRRTGIKIDELLAEGYEQDLIRNALQLMRERAKWPELLPDLVNELLNPPQGTRRNGSTPPRQTTYPDEAYDDDWPAEQSA
jgi:hypothetical protein